MRKTALALVLSAALPAGAQSPAPPDVTPRSAPSSATAPTPPAASPSPTPATPTSPGALHARKEPVERGTVLQEVAGKVADIDRKAHLLRIETTSGPVTLSLDRNTMVYTATGLGTVLDVLPGSQIRAGRNADDLAYWVQVRAAPTPPASTPGQGTGPAGGGSAAAGEGVGPGAGAAPTTGAGPGVGGAGPGGSTPH